MELFGALQNESVRLKFWSRVEVRGPEECWPWKAGRVPYGYGAFHAVPKLPRNFNSHRIAWIITHGTPIPHGLVVRHACDNPPCCNPAHLLLGTVGDNIRDSYVRQRRPHQSTAADHAAAMPRGVKHWKARLNDDVVRNIRARYALGDSNIAISRATGVERSLISHVINRHIWAHVV